MASFQDVQKILKAIIEDWKKTNEIAPNLSGKHHDPSFGWENREQLLSSKAVLGGKTYLLIDPLLIGNGKGVNTNLVIALTKGVDGYPRMPDGGPYLAPADIQTIVNWIDEGCQ